MLVALDDKLYMYGGKDGMINYSTLAIYDTVSECRSPLTRGDVSGTAASTRR